MKKFSFLVVMLATCITLQAQEEISVSRAIEITEALAEGASTTKQYIVKGVVSEINTTDEGIATYKNCDFWMSDRDNATLKIKAFRTKGIAGLDFTVGMIAVGDTVKVQGVLMHYVNTTTSEELLEIYKGNLVEVVVGSNAIYYKFDDANLTATVTYRGSYYNSYANEYKGNVVIPATVTYGGKTYSVTSIGSSAFKGCSGLTSVTIPNSVTNIGYSAFRGCSGLTSVTIPNSVTSIGNYAFDGCSGLTSVTIGNSVTSIGSYAFDGCSSLTSVTIGNSVTSIGSYAFGYCSGLTSVVWNAKNCADCSSSYGSDAPFYNIKSQITSFTFGSEVEHIPAYLCYGMENLTSVTIGNSVTSIGDQAFYNCSGLTSVTIGNSVTSIGDKAFRGCSSLTSVVWNAKNCADFRGSGYAPFYDIKSQITSFTFGSEVEHIPAYLCYGMENLTSVTIPNNVTSIGDYAFRGCSGLTSVTIGNSVTSIGDWAFRACSGLTSVTIPNSVTSIGKYAFYGCSGLTSVTIGNSVTSIGKSAFGECTQLINIVCYAAEPPSCDASSVFANYDASLKVPCNSLEAYKAAAVWRLFNNISYIESTVGLDQIELAGLYTQAGRIVCNGEFRIYDLIGRDVTRLNGSLQGVYVVKTANAAVKVVVR